jgi:hypothetical protein
LLGLLLTSHRYRSLSQTSHLVLGVLDHSISTLALILKRTYQARRLAHLPVLALDLLVLVQHEVEYIIGRHLI